MSSRSHRLLSQYPDTPLQRWNDEFVMGRVNGGDYQDVELGLVEHLEEVFLTVSGSLS